MSAISSTHTPRIFVSHSHFDETFTMRVVAAFEAAGAVVWVDKHGIKEGDFLKRINEGLAQSDWLVLIETPHSLTSDAVEMEVNAAQNRVLYHQMRGVLRLLAAPFDPALIKPTWATLQFYDATQDFTAAIAATLDAIRTGDARWAERERQSPGATLPATPVPTAQQTTTPAGRLLAGAAAAYTANDWHAVADVTNILLNDEPAAMTADGWRMRGRALLELRRLADAQKALATAYNDDTFDLPTLRLLARTELALDDNAHAAERLERALGLANLIGNEGIKAETKLDILREYVPTLQALNRPQEALDRIEQALLLRPNDPAWLTQKLALLQTLNRPAEALAIAQQLASSPHATANDWLTLARLTRAQHPSPADASDTDIRKTIQHALDEADRRADASGHGAITQARRELLPALPQPISVGDHFPQRLAQLGFVGLKMNGVEVITPPLCAVPAGPFLMGSDPRRDSEARSNEQPQHSVTLAPYQIGTYPVTVAEYACYVRATGKQPSGWQDQLAKLDHPVVNVSWHDALAYTRWLAQVTSQPWRLPTEAEWEKAARGTDGRIYPWGNQWDKTHANTRDGGPYTTTPVGSYPSGASPYGAQDMAGNVWEWCSSLYKEQYPYDPAASEDNGRDRTSVRVLRGGSWDLNPEFARAAFRLSGRPDLFISIGGFRLAFARSRLA